ncbi:MAG: superoxide dismutase [Velocimicrobium sp.]
MNEHYPFVNTPLPYAYDAMEPYIDRKTMELHHDKHLQAYIDHLNLILKEYRGLQKLSLEKLIVNAPCYPRQIQSSILNNAGGVYNHRFFFSNLVNTGEIKPVGELSAQIDATFDNYFKFREKFVNAALSVFGSGYAWLVADQKKRLYIITTPNQNTPLLQNLCPILCIDVWEHAYYLKYYNVRASYINAWFHVINWKQANINYMQFI